MGEEYFKNILMPTEPFHQLSTPAVTVEEARVIMCRHGCKLENLPGECVISFPAGTTRTELLPRTMSGRYCIRLPDGYELCQIYDRFREINIVLYTPE